MISTKGFFQKSTPVKPSQTTKEAPSSAIRMSMGTECRPEAPSISSPTTPRSRIPIPNANARGSRQTIAHNRTPTQTATYIPSPVSKKIPSALTLQDKGSSNTDKPKSKPVGGHNSMTAWLNRHKQLLRDSPEAETPGSPIAPRKRYRKLHSRRSAEKLIIDWVNKTGTSPPADCAQIDSEEEQEESQHRSVSMSPVDCIGQQNGAMNTPNNNHNDETLLMPEPAPAPSRQTQIDSEKEQEESQHRSVSMSRVDCIGEQNGAMNTSNNNHNDETLLMPVHAPAPSRQTQVQQKRDGNGWISTTRVVDSTIQPNPIREKSHRDSQNRRPVNRVMVNEEQSSSNRNREQPSTSLVAYSHVRAPTKKIPAKKQPTAGRPVSPISVNSDDDSDVCNRRERGSTVSSGRSNARKTFFTHNEKQKMLDWVCEREDHDRIMSQSLYVEMEEADVCPGRGFHSLSNSFRKHIVYNLDKFKISEENKKKLKRRLQGKRY